MTVECRRIPEDLPLRYCNGHRGPGQDSVEGSEMSQDSLEPSSCLRPFADVRRLPVAGGRRRRLAGREKLIVFVLALANFSSMLALATPAPFFPREAQSKGASTTVVGLIFGSFQLTIFIMSPIYGSLVTKLGARFMLLSGLFISSVCIVLFGFLDASPPGGVYIALCFICRIIDANGTAMLTTASFVLLAHNFPEHLTMVMGFAETSIALGAMMGPATGGLLYQIGGFKLPFFVVGGVIMVAFVWSYFCVPDAESSCEISKFYVLLKIPDAVLAFFGIFTANLQVTFTDPVLAKQILSIDSTLSPAIIGCIFLVGSTVYAILSPLVGYCCDKWGGKLRLLMCTGWGIGTVSLLALGPSPLAPFLSKSMWLLVLSLALLDASSVCAWLPSYQLALNAAIENGHPDNLNTYGMIGGLMGSGAALGSFIGLSASGYLTEKIGFGWTTTCFASLALVMAAATATSALLPALKRWCSRKRIKNCDDGELEPLLPRCNGA